MTQTYDFREIRARLKTEAEEDFKNFNSKIIPTAYPVLGVRTPTVRKLAKSAGEDYLEQSPAFYEEVLIHGITLGKFKTANELFSRIDTFLSFVDNWAAIDVPLSSMTAFKKDKENCLQKLKSFLFDKREFYARFGAVALLDYYIDSEHIDEVLRLYAQDEEGRYYTDMAVAWGLSVAAVKFFDKTYAALKSGLYGDFTTRKALSKCMDSFRIDAEQKQLLKQLRSNLRK